MVFLVHRPCCRCFAVSASRTRRVAEHLSHKKMVNSLDPNWEKFLGSQLAPEKVRRRLSLFAVDHNGIRTETDVLPVSRCAQNSLQHENEFYANVTLS